MDNKFIIAGLFFIFIILSGFLLSHAGKPINVLILTVHKLISLAALVFIAITVYRIHQVVPLSPIEIAASVVTLVFFVALMATGGLLSTINTMPGIVLKVHQIMPYLAIFSTAVNLYLLVVRKQY